MHITVPTSDTKRQSAIRVIYRYAIGIGQSESLTHVPADMAITGDKLSVAPGPAARLDYGERNKLYTREFLMDISDEPGHITKINRCDYWIKHYFNPAGKRIVYAFKTLIKSAALAYKIVMRLLTMRMEADKNLIKAGIFKFLHQSMR